MKKRAIFIGFFVLLLSGGLGLWAAKTAGIYPLPANKGLIYWTRLDTSVAQLYKNRADTPLYKEMEKRTGVKVKFVHPVAGNEAEQFNIMIASRVLPDIIEYCWSTIPGGMEKAVEDGYVQPLNSLINKSAPNLKKLFSSDKQVALESKTDTGKVTFFPFVQAEMAQVFQGAFLRNDWLKELGLAAPTTIDEWYNVLKEFKVKKKCDAPLSFRYLTLLSSNTFVGAYGTSMDFYINKGKVVYGPVQPRFKEFLITMRKWYAEKLLDNDFASIDAKTLDAKMASGKAGATIGNAGSGIGRYYDAVEKTNPKYDLIPVPYPSLKKGEIAEFGQRVLKVPALAYGNAAITTTCSNKELAVRYLDYGYSPEGHLLMNFGIENVSYQLDNGYPAYTNLIRKNPDGLGFGQALAKYARAIADGPFVQDNRYQEQYMERPQQKEALKIWAKTNAASHLMPNLTPLPEESDKLAKIVNELNAYRDEMVLKFIMGIEPINNYDQFVNTLKSMGVEQAVKIYQDALKRYRSR